MNPAPGRKDLERRLLPLTDIICTNQNETEFITGLTLKTLDEFKEAAAKVLEYGPKLVSIKKSSKHLNFKSYRLSLQWVRMARWLPKDWTMEK